jgi:probable phosphoglycerate mutase
MEFVFVRHGESTFNAEGRFCGQVDAPLTALGHAQAAATAAELAGSPLAWVVSSTLVRARDTASAVAAPHGVSVELDGRLVEHRKGVLEGTPMRRLRSLDWSHVDGAESMVEFYRRCCEAVVDLVARPGLGAVVAHGGVARAIECLRVGGAPELLYDAAKPANAETYVVSLDAAAISRARAAAHLA